MSYNKQYNTRNSTGRYNAPGQFVSAGESGTQTYNPLRKQAAPPPPPPNQNQIRESMNQNIQTINHNLQPIQTMDIEMKTTDQRDVPSSAASTVSDTSSRPYWMKSKLPGVKKVSNKERRRRQNENLRKLLTPKNALMVLNEMLPNEQLANQFKVEPASQFSHQYYSNKQQVSFCADLTINGNTYKGYGENKLTARNLAAEQAIRDLIIQRMNKVMTSEIASVASPGAAAAVAAAGEDTDEEALPMIQLASFALHKLFSEWEYEGHKVPQLKQLPNASISETGSDSGAAAAAAAAAGAAAAAKSKQKKKELPPNAANMHPCMLLTYMRPHLEYRELAVTGERPQTLVFTLGVDVDGATYIGKASNKKEARKLAAKSACQELFGVKFNENATENAPQLAAATATATATA